MNRSTFFIIFLVITNILIFVFVDSIYCSADWFFIALGIIPQFIMTYLLLQDVFPKEKEAEGKLSKEKVIVFIFICFLATYNGNLGVDKTGRTTDCPNTWLQYLKE